MNHNNNKIFKPLTPRFLLYYIFIKISSTIFYFKPIILKEKNANKKQTRLLKKYLSKKTPPLNFNFCIF